MRINRVTNPAQYPFISHYKRNSDTALEWTVYIQVCYRQLGQRCLFPSIPMASMIFSVLSIMKAVFDLNIYPLVREYEISSRTFKISFDLILCFMPHVNAIFRICVFSLMFVFLDFWSIIPCLVLFLLNLMIFGLSFERYSYAATTYGSDGW